MTCKYVNMFMPNQFQDAPNVDYLEEISPKTTMHLLLGPIETRDDIMINGSRGRIVVHLTIMSRAFIQGAVEYSSTRLIYMHVVTITPVVPGTCRS